MDSRGSEELVNGSNKDRRQQMEGEANSGLPAWLGCCGQRTRCCWRSQFVKCVLEGSKVVS